MKPIALIRAAALAPVVSALETRGARVEALLERAGLPADAVDHDEQLIPLRQAFRFLADAARSERLPELGLIAGEAASIANLGVLGRLVQRARTLGEALTTISAMAPTFSSGERWWLDVHDAEALLCHTFLDPPSYGHDEANHYSVAIAINILRTVAGPDWSPPEVRFSTGPVSGLGERTLLRGTRLLFRQPCNAVAFPSALLVRPLPALATSPGDDLDAWLASAPAVDFAGSVKQLMWSMTSDNGHPRMRRTAMAVGVSVRTLQRRLAENGLSFEQLLRADRLRMAVRYLEQTNARVLDIALDLGYSDHAHFTRAFRRWTGLTPLEYRRAWVGRGSGVVRATRPGIAPTITMTTRWP